MSVAPAAKAALQQANALWPDRNRKSDGLAGDVRHWQDSPRSWHLPRRPARPGESTENGNRATDGRIYVIDGDNGMVLAVDLTDDPLHGCDAHALVLAAVARGDRRVMEAISNRRIWTKRRAAEGWRPYTGANPHDKHAHITVDPAFADDVSPWWRVPAPTPAPPPEPDEEIPMRYVRADVTRGEPEHGKVYVVTAQGRTWVKSGFRHMHWLAARGLGPKPTPGVTSGDQGFDIETWPLVNLLTFPYLGES